MSAPLVARRGLPAALAAVLIAVAGVTALSVWLYRRSDTTVDSWFFRELRDHLGPAVADGLLALSEPVISLVVLGLVAGVAALNRRWDVAVLAVLPPIAAVVVTEYVLKPLIARQISVAALSSNYTDPPRGAFPSGHETGVASTALVLLLLWCHVPARPALRYSVVAVLVLWVLAAAVGLVRNFYHFATDTVGAIGVSTVVVVGGAVLIDRWLPALVPDRSPQLT